MSVRGPSATTNPYVVQLVDALRAEVPVQYFTWARGIVGRYDVLHVHWPEVMVRRASRPAAWAAQLRFALLLARTAVLRTAVVRTLHNVTAHERGGRAERLLLRWCDRRTALWIRLNAETPLPHPAPAPVVPHGHYVDWFAAHGDSGPRAGRLVTVGLIRPYKGVDVLLDAFRALPDAGVELRVVGRPTTPELADMVTAACAADPRIGALLAHVDDASLAAEVHAAQLVVLPYRQMHNSGALLLALSLGRPVLVPRSPVTLALADEVGPGWVLTHDGPLTAGDLADALAATAQRPPSLPDLSGRDWARVGELHLRAYEEAVTSAGAERRSGATAGG